MSNISQDDAPYQTGLEMQVGEWQIFPTLNRIARRGERVALQNLSMQVLVYLTQRPGVVATYDELLDAFWPGKIAAEDAVHRRIADLRRHLNDDARSPRYIETIPKRGYRLVAKVHRPKLDQRDEPHVIDGYLFGAVIITAAIIVAAIVISVP